MRTVVIEDEINNLNLLSHFIKKYCPEIELVGSCQNKKDGVTLIDFLKPTKLHHPQTEKTKSSCTFTILIENTV